LRLPIEVERAHSTRKVTAGRPRVVGAENVGKTGSDSGRWRLRNLEQYRRESRERSARRYVRRAEWLKDVKLRAQCAVCGYAGNPGSIDAHHVNPHDKKFLVSLGNVVRSREVFYAEMQKCAWVCKNCHYEIHHQKIDVSGLALINPDDYPPMPF
jgi:hypothetical protein